MNGVRLYPLYSKAHVSGGIFAILMGRHYQTHRLRSMTPPQNHPTSDTSTKNPRVVLGVLITAALSVVFIGGRRLLTLPPAPLPEPVSLAGEDPTIVETPPAKKFTRQGGIGRRLLLPCLFGVIFVLAAGAPLLYSQTTMTQRKWGDQWAFWVFAQQTRDTLCVTFAYCQPTGEAPIGTEGIFFYLSLSKMGVMPALMGVALTVFPNTVETTEHINMLLAGLGTVLLVHMLLRLRFPHWVAALAGVFTAFYVPGIVNTLPFLQQPFIRFILIATLWAYTLSFRASRWWAIVAFTVLGGVSTFLLAFSSLTTRPLMWLISLGMLGLSLTLRPAKKRFSHTAVVIVCVVLQCLALIALYQNPIINRRIMDDRDIANYLLLGVSLTHGDEVVTTVRSFVDFWAPSDFINSRQNRTESLVRDFAENPVDFLRWFNFSLFNNWRYPDTAFFQTFILSVTDQHRQHTLLLYAGILGGAFWSGLPGIRRRTLLLLVLIGGFLCAAYSVISVEPRRFNIFMPFVAAAAAIFLHSLSRRTVRDILSSVGVSVIFFAVWSLPLGIILQIAPLRVETAHLLICLLRAGVSGGVAVFFLRLWITHTPFFRSFFPALVLAGIWLALVLGMIQDQDWRLWGTTVQTPIRQEVRGVQPEDHRFPWLLIDADSADYLPSVEIRLNGTVIKPPGTPLFMWEAGPTGRWYPYIDLLLMNNFPPRRMWYAYPLPLSLINSDLMTIELDPGDIPFPLRGDFRDPADTRYAGPSFDPWMSGHSFWRWQWNGDDPRILQPQSLNGFYKSAYNVGKEWYSADLSDEWGRQTGTYRIYIVWDAIGSESNALFRSGTGLYRTLYCPDGSFARVGVNPCYLANGNIQYFTDVGYIGTSQRSVFDSMTKKYALIDSMENDKGRVEVLQVLNNAFVANYYRPSGEHVYSYVFEVNPR